MAGSALARIGSDSYKAQQKAAGCAQPRGSSVPAEAGVKMSLTMMYTCGLRISEALRLHCHDIDSKRMLVCVRNGKGAKDRYVPLPQRTLERLRIYWCQVRPKTWLFPTTDGLTPIHKGTIRRCLVAALAQTDIHKHVTCQTLRHSYATHLMEQGVELAPVWAKTIRAVQEIRFVDGL